MPAGQSLVVKPAANFRGLLELSGASDLSFAPRLARTGASADLAVTNVAQPTAAASTRLSFAPPAGTYRKLRLVMVVDHDGWNCAKASALHQLFGLVKDTNKNMFGYLSLCGPNTNQIQLWQGLG